MGSRSLGGKTRGAGLVQCNERGVPVKFSRSGCQLLIEKTRKLLAYPRPHVYHAADRDFATLVVCIDAGRYKDRRDSTSMNPGVDRASRSRHVPSSAAPHSAGAGTSPLASSVPQTKRSRNWFSWWRRGRRATRNGVSGASGTPIRNCRGLPPPPSR